MKLTLDCTCSACPEQYNVYDETGKQVAYYRLRHGYFQVTVPGVFGELVYSANPKGDGIFDPEERDYYLKEAERAVLKYYQGGKEIVYVVYDYDKDIRGVFSSREKAEIFIGERLYFYISELELDEGE